MLRIVLFIHRYLAVAVGLLMALWCLSGFVMLYQQYPDYPQAARLRALEPLDLAGCCNTDFLPDDAEAAGGFRVEMQNGRAVLREDGVAPFDLVTGTPVPDLTQADLLAIAQDHARRTGLTTQAKWLAQIDVDQWTLQSARRNRPVHHFSLQDAAGTELYVNGASGEIFQKTTRRERVLAWLGAIPHWLYPTALRRNGPLWAQIVIWTSVIGTFLTATGLYVGISRLRRRRDGKLASPFRGWWYWHHISGLTFGVLTLTWVFSGLLTMNPWGLLEGSNIGDRVAPQLEGSTTTGELRRFLRAAPGALGAGFTQLRSQPFGGQLFVMARLADGTAVRLDADARPAPLTAEAVQQVVGKLDTGLQSLTLLQSGDAYYYAHKAPMEFPVYRAVLGDDQATRLYISPTTGDFRIVDSAARKTRWLERGLHGLDFDGLRSRPLWDVLTILLLAGVTAVCVTGSWMAIQRVRKDFSRS